MIHTIVYDNRTGYGFYERSQDFPIEYEASVAEVCNAISDGKDRVTNEQAYRYAPLKDKFLLSVVMRYPKGNADQIRAHKAVVNFLMDEDTADRLWLYPVSQCIKAAGLAANEILEKYRGKFIDSAILQHYISKLKDTEKIPVSRDKTEILLTGLLCCGDGRVHKQLFVQTQENPGQLLDSVVEKIPENMRKYIRFMTDVYNDAESMDISLCLHSYPLSTNQSGSPATDKIRIRLDDVNKGAQFALGRKALTLYEQELYSFYRRCIRNWKEYSSLIEIAESKSFDKKVLSVLGEDKVLEEINPSLTITELAELYKSDFANRDIKYNIKIMAEHKSKYEPKNKRLDVMELMAYQSILPDYKEDIQEEVYQEPMVEQELEYEQPIKDVTMLGRRGRQRAVKDINIAGARILLIRVVCLFATIIALFVMVKKQIAVSAVEQIVTVQISGITNMALLCVIILLSFFAGILIRDIWLRYIISKNRSK